MRIATLVVASVYAGVALSAPTTESAEVQSTQAERPSWLGGPPSSSSSSSWFNPSSWFKSKDEASVTSYNTASQNDRKPSPGWFSFPGWGSNFGSNSANYAAPASSGGFSGFMGSYFGGSGSRGWGSRPNSGSGLRPGSGSSPKPNAWAGLGGTGSTGGFGSRPVPQPKGEHSPSPGVLAEPADSDAPRVPNLGESQGWTQAPKPNSEMYHPKPNGAEISRSGLWQPRVAEPFQIILTGHPDTNVKITPENVNIFDLDLFNTPATTIRALGNQGKKIICYFSAGSSEDWRPDYKQFLKSDMGNRIAKDDAGSSYWEGERWLNIKNPNPNSPNLPVVWRIMRDRIKLASEKGCHAIDPDNTDGFSNTNGLGLQARDSVNFFRFMANEARKYNMSIGLKNSDAILSQVQDIVQFAVNEECAANGECSVYKNFLKSKPVFHIEYTKVKTGASSGWGTTYPYDEESSSSSSSSSSGARGGSTWGKNNKGSNSGGGGLFGQKKGSSRNFAVEAEGADRTAISRYCTPSNAPDLGPKFSTVIKVEALDGWVRFCDGRTATTRIKTVETKGRFSFEGDGGDNKPQRGESRGFGNSEEESDD